MRLGLIGAGRWGRRYIQTLAAMPGVQLARLGSRNPESAGLVPPGCAISQDWREVATATDLDGVIVATPPSLHAEMAIASLRAGNAVLLEKPMTLDPAEAEAVAAASRESGRPVVVEHTHLFSEAYRALKAHVPVLGDVLHIEACAGNSGPNRHDVEPLWDWGSHDVAMCLDLAGCAPGAVSATRNRYERREDGIAEDVELWLSFPTGVTAHIHVSNLRNEKLRRFAVHCRDGVLVFDDLAADKLCVCTRGGKRHVPPLPGVLPLTRAVSDFCDLVRSGGCSCGSLDIGRECVNVLHKARLWLG